MKSRRVLALTDVRARLSGIVHDAERTSEPIGISVHGEVKAYVIGADALARLEKQVSRRGRSSRTTRLRGSLRIVGDLEAASRMIAESIQDTAGKLRGD